MAAATAVAHQWKQCTNAIVVCGHAVFCGGPLSTVQDTIDETRWFLQDFQKGEHLHYVEHVRTALKEAQTFIGEIFLHRKKPRLTFVNPLFYISCLQIRHGVQLAAKDPQALLIFSGGQTRFPLRLSEAQGYYDVAKANSFWLHTDTADSTLENRITTEEFARDSYDNVLFGIARFCECVGKLPKKLTLVSWNFKRHRFLHHADTIRWPMHRFTFEGVSNPGRNRLDAAIAAETATLNKFCADASGYGLKSEGALGHKKIQRDPYKRHHGYVESCAVMRNVLTWRGSTRLPEEIVPWNEEPNR